MKKELIKKIRKELEDFRNEMLSCSKEEIYANAYEITMKEEIAVLLDHKIISNERAKALCNLSNSLDFFYNTWMNGDYDLLYEAIDFVLEEKQEDISSDREDWI